MNLDTKKQNSITPFKGQLTGELYLDANSYNLPKKAKVFTSTHYSDGTSWNLLDASLPLRPTKFYDDRLLILKPVDSTTPPIELEASLSGKYDIKVYRNKDIVLCIEGDQTILIKLPFTQNIISWNSPERLPVLPKTWRPTYFMLNSNNIFVRIIPEKCLVISKINETDSFKVKAINFADGFCCCHPITNLALLNGDYNQSQELNVMKLPPLPKSNGSYNYSIQFFSWGTMIIPKFVEIAKGPFCNLKKSGLAVLVIPPKVNITIDLKSSAPVGCTLEYNTDFFITARKPSLTEIEVYLIIHDQLVVYEYSFDLRLNKDSAPVCYKKIPIEFTLTKEEKEKKKKNPNHKCKWTFINNKEQKVLIPSSNSVTGQHLMSDDLACVFDAETGIYYSTEHGIRHCKIFNKLKAANA